MGGSHKKMFHKVFILGLHRGLAFSAATLAVVKRNGVSFDIAGFGYGDHHVFFHNHVFKCDLAGFFHDLCSPGITELVLDFGQLILDQFQDNQFTAQNLLEPFNIFKGFSILLNDFFLFQAREPLKPHIEYGLSLNR